MFFSIFKHKHKWHDRKFNQHGLPTVQLCNCGELREITMVRDSKNIGHNFFWKYSDGALEKDERVFKHN